MEIRARQLPAASAATVGASVAAGAGDVAVGAGAVEETAAVAGMVRAAVEAEGLEGAAAMVAEEDS
jgi:hypothetical protein